MFNVDAITTTITIDVCEEASKAELFEGIPPETIAAAALMIVSKSVVPLSSTDTPTSTSLDIEAVASTSLVSVASIKKAYRTFIPHMKTLIREDSVVKYGRRIITPIPSLE
jgi:hypothetical protein